MEIFLDLWYFSSPQTLIQHKKDKEQQGGISLASEHGEGARTKRNTHAKITFRTKQKKKTWSKTRINYNKFINHFSVINLLLIPPRFPAILSLNSYSTFVKKPTGPIIKIFHCPVSLISKTSPQKMNSSFTYMIHTIKSQPETTTQNYRYSTSKSKC